MLAGLRKGTNSQQGEGPQEIQAEDADSEQQVWKADRGNTSLVCNENKKGTLLNTYESRADLRKQYSRLQVSHSLLPRESK